MSITHLEVEADVIKRTKIICEKHNIWHKRIVAWGKGLPDFIACVNGIHLSIECKRPSVGEKGLSAWQKQHKDEILEAGGKWICVYDEHTLSSLDIKICCMKKRVVQ